MLFMQSVLDAAATSPPLGTEHVLKPDAGTPARKRTSPCAACSGCSACSTRMVTAPFWGRGPIGTRRLRTLFPRVRQEQGRADHRRGTTAGRAEVAADGAARSLCRPRSAGREGTRFLSRRVSQPFRTGCWPRKATCGTLPTSRSRTSWIRNSTRWLWTTTRVLLPVRRLDREGAEFGNGVAGRGIPASRSRGTKAPI